MKAPTTETQKAIQVTKKLFNNSKTAPELEDCLDICLESFDAVLESNKVVSFAPGQDILQLKGQLHGTVTLIHDSDDAFKCINHKGGTTG